MAAVLVNGINYSWPNLTNIAFGVPVIGITAINWTKKQNKENNMGWGSEPISRGYGNKEYECSITVYKDWWKSVVDATATKDATDIAPFDWTISLAGPGVTPVTHTLKNFEFLEDKFVANQGDTKLTMDIPCIFAGVVTS